MDAMESRRSIKAASFTESVIRDFTRLSDLHGAINLGQGFPDFPAPEEVKEAARRAIADDHNQYPVTWGVPAFREAIAASVRSALRHVGRSRHRRLRHVRLDRGDDRRHARAARSGRRGRRVRALLRELRAGRDPVRRGPAAGHAPSSRLDVRRRRAARGVQRPHARDRRELAEQPDREGVLAGGAVRRSRSSACATTRSRSPTRSTSTSRTTAWTTSRSRRSRAWRTGP